MDREMDRDEILEGLSALLGHTVSTSRGGNVTPLPVTALTTTAFGYHPVIGAAVGYLRGAVTAAVSPRIAASVYHPVDSVTAHRQDFGVDEKEFFDPEYDYDFRDLSDSDSECERGGETYKRPIGWNRIALKVWGKYETNDWLGGGKKEWRNESAKGEWPVAYHGTSIEGAKGILQQGFKIPEGSFVNGKKVKAVYGRGVYCTPDIDVAERDGYAATFTSRKSGKTYKVALQGRINPKYRKVVNVEKKYWLIPVEEGLSAEEERNFVDKALRSYGILFKKIKD